VPVTDEGGVHSGSRREPGWKKFLSTAIEAWRARAAARALRARPGREPRLSRSRAGVALDARLAVRAGVRLDDFLRHRLASYAARLPVPMEDLPVRIDVENGEPVVYARPRPAAHAASPSAAPKAAQERWLRALEQREGPAAVRELQSLEARVAQLDRRAADARDRIAAVSRTIADDLASGALPAAPAVDATPEQLGRPPVTTALPIHLLRGFSLALLAAEAWRLADPVLAAMGLSVAELPRAAERAPASVALGLVFALGAAAAVFTFLGVAVSRLHAVADDPGAPRHRAALVTVAIGAAVLAAAVAAAGATPGRIGEEVLLVAVPLAAVLMVRHAARLESARAGAVAAALAWDRERAAEVVARAQRAEGLARAEHELARVAEEQSEVSRKLRALETRAIAASRAAEELEKREARRLDRLAESLSGALELDRYVFVKVASADAHELLARPVRPARVEPAVASGRLGVAG
jgi:hypothetical protein